LGKVEEYKQKLEEFEKQREKERRLFTPDDILASSDEVKRVYIPEIDREIEYCPLSLDDLAYINKAKSDEERGIRILHRMLSKANPEWTLEKVKKIPLGVATAILQRILTPFPEAVSADGLPRILGRKPSD